MMVERTNSTNASTTSINNNTNNKSNKNYTNFQLLYATQTGHSKACARRCARILKQSIPIEKASNTNNINNPNKIISIPPIQSFDEYGIQKFLQTSPSSSSNKTFLICFISTTGEGEQTDGIQTVWKYMLQKSLSPTTLSHVNFVVFSLGDRNYGPDLFCAAGRKLTSRMIQLGATLLRSGDGSGGGAGGSMGYGDEDGDTLQDLDDWLDGILLPSFGRRRSERIELVDMDIPFELQCSNNAILKEKNDDEWYIEYLKGITPNNTTYSKEPYRGSVTCNRRLTSSDWDQNVRHISIEVQLPAALSPEENYKAGDVAVVYPLNPSQSVDTLLTLLSSSLQSQADHTLVCTELSPTKPHNYPSNCSFRSYLTNCADIHAPPEREDLYLLSHFCRKGPQSEVSAHAEKLQFMSSTQGSELYVDYIIRQRRNWLNVLFDFNTILFESVREVMHVLPLTQPRYFSIASAPTANDCTTNMLRVELCVAKIEQTTSLGRCFEGLCSTYLTNIQSGDAVYFYIKPGSFHSLPCAFSSEQSMHFDKPLLCIGAGTGVAPLRGIIQYREQLRNNRLNCSLQESNYLVDTTLLFGCRKQAHDFIYQTEWNSIKKTHDHFQLHTAFSQDNRTTLVKTYVQTVLHKHIDEMLGPIIEQQGAIYIAGNVKMCQGVKEIIQEYVTSLVGGNEVKAIKVLKRWKHLGLFCIEAW